MNVVIIGCGYIGSHLAQSLKAKGIHVTATTRHPEKLTELSRIAQKTIILRGDNEDEIIPLIANNEAIFITVAPDNAELYESTYLYLAQIFRKLALEMDLPRHLFYSSSTSVYGDHHGLWVDETSDLHGLSEQAKILIETENVYRSLEELGWTVCIFRFSEIYGPGRELSRRVKQLEGHVLPGSGDHYTNMVHQDDCAAALTYALRHNLEGTFNLTDDEHPIRKTLYEKIAHKFGYKEVKWDPHLASLHTGNKRISNHKIKSEGFTFRHPHRVLD